MKQSLVSVLGKVYNPEIILPNYLKAETVKYLFERKES